MCLRWGARGAMYVRAPKGALTPHEDLIGARKRRLLYGPLSLNIVELKLAPPFEAAFGLKAARLLSLSTLAGLLVP